MIHDTSAASSPPDRIRIGISSCLLGERVRYDGNHKQDSFIRETLGRVFDFIAVCPEVAIGMGVPRPPIRLTGDPQSPRVVGVQDPALDVTAALTAYGRRMALELDGISGYIFKGKSPSCGLRRVKVYGGGAPSMRGTGVYAREIVQRRPLLPAEEEGRLGDPVLRENFIARVFAYRRWQSLLASGFSVGKLVEFHTAHKLSLMSHGTEYYRALGRLVADAKSHRPAVLCERYGAAFMAALQRSATHKRHTDVLMHVMGYLKTRLDKGDKAELLEVIESYRLGHVPLIVPITLLRHYFRRFPDEYIAKQVYLNPHPAELMLRNGI